jgi:hypothetical protein
MRKIILALFLLACCGQQVEAQPRQANTKPQRQEAGSDPSPAAAASPQAEAAREAYRKERDAKDDAFRADQSRQNEIIATASNRMVWITAVNVFIALVYAYFAYRTLIAVKNQAEYAGAQVRKMQGQLRVMKKQTGLAQKTVMQTARMVKQNEKMVKATQGQLTSMQVQEKTMHGQLEAMKLQEGHMQTQSAAMSSQLGIMWDGLKADRDSIDLTWEALKTQKRAYLGIDRMNIDLKQKKRLWVYLKNLGKTPASNVKAEIQVTMSTPTDWHEQHPESVRNFPVGGETYTFNLTTINPDSVTVQVGFPLGLHFSPEELDMVTDQKSRLTVNLSLDYHDGFDPGFAYFVLTYRGKDTHGYDTWGIFPSEAEKNYDQANPERPELKMY